MSLAALAVQPSLSAFNGRMPAMKRQIPAITASAENAAARILGNPGALLNTPYWEQVAFSEEMINRAGGLAHAYPTGAPGRTPETRHDVVLLTLGWMWCCEYAAAMSRKGKFPAILYSVAMPGADEYDAKIQTPDGRHTVVDCPTPVPAGKLAGLYLRRIGKMITDVKSRRIQWQLAQAADVVAARMAVGSPVGLAGMGHAIIEEVKMDNRAPWKAFQAVGSPRTAFSANLKPGELLVWMTYCGMNSKYDDYAKYIAEAKVDLITCYAPDPEWSKNPPPTLAHIDQSWKLPDAEVPIPVYPHSMAPISNINVTLLMRMLDDAVMARLEKTKAPK